MAEAWSPQRKAMSDLSDSDSGLSSSISRTDSKVSAISSATESSMGLGDDPQDMRGPPVAKPPMIRRKSASGPLELSLKPGRHRDKPWLIMLFTFNLIVGVIISQIAGSNFSHDAHHSYQEGVAVITMSLLAYIMIGVGCEFNIDKANLRKYGKDYGVAMTAAGFPWIFVGLWFVFMLPTPMWWGEALFTARFAAPTSAGILFTMLAAAGLTDTWLFRKARVLAIFDDLDTILFMLPLKVLVTGAHYELIFDVLLVTLPLIAAWRYMHEIKIPHSWAHNLVYAVLIVGFCKGLHYT